MPSILDRFWEGLVSVLGASWRVSWGVLGRLGGVSGASSADDGKRLSEYLQVRSCAVRFMSEKRDDIEKTRGGVRGGEGLGVAPRGGVSADF